VVAPAQELQYAASLQKNKRNKLCCMMVMFVMAIVVGLWLLRQWLTS
jgi:hypothetical protein